MSISPLRQFCEWLEQTEPSRFIQDRAWVVPAVQTIHILAISAVAGSALFINLRLLGLLCTDQPLESVSKRFAPVIWWSLPILLATGIVLTLGEPARELLNPVFRLKMLLILAGMALLALFQKNVSRDANRYDGAQKQKAAAFAIAIPSLLVWAGIIFAGRWIAYI